MDLAMTIIWFNYQGEKALQEIKAAYFQEDTEDETLLSAAIFIQSLKKLYLWHKRSKSEDKVKSWLEGIIPLYRKLILTLQS
jgi:hypothetical protein